MRTSTKQLWFVLINTTIDTHFLIYALYIAVKNGNIGVWISAAAIITALWTLSTIMYQNNNKRKTQENIENLKSGVNNG
jgi:hypothetical protein